MSMARVVAKSHKDALGFGLTPEAILMPESHATARTIYICVVCTAIQDHSDIRAQIAGGGGGGHVWVRGPTVARVCVDVSGSYYL